MVLIFLIALNLFALTETQLETQARLLLEDSSSSTDEQHFSPTEYLNWINIAQKEIASLTWCVKKSTTIASVAGQESYTLPTDYYSPDRVVFKGRVLTPTSEDELYAQKSYWTDDSSSTLTQYYFIRQYPNSSGDNTLHLYKKPDTASNMTVQYIAIPADLSVSSDVPFNSDKKLVGFHYLIPLWVASKGWLLQGDINKANGFYSQYIQGVYMMRRSLNLNADFPIHYIPEIKKLEQ